MSKSGEDVNTEAYIKEHIKRVHKWIRKFAYALFERGESHDASKLREPEFSQWEAMDREPRYPYSSKEYKNKIKKYASLFNEHYRRNRHHPEHWQGYYFEIDIIDLVEMLCDWLGYKEDITIQEAVELVNQQVSRFRFNSTIKHLLLNTIIHYFAIDEEERLLKKIDEYESSDKDKHIDIYV